METYTALIIIYILLLALYLYHIYYVQPLKFKLNNISDIVEYDCIKLSSFKGLVKEKSETKKYTRKKK